MFFITLAVLTALCLAMPFTRLYGVVGAVTLLYFYTYYTLALLGVFLVAGIAFHQFLRRKSNA